MASIERFGGADSGVPALRDLFGEGSLGLVTIGTAPHRVSPEVLLPEPARVLRPGGGVAVLADSPPVWPHDTASG
ncbi:hypothetical protein CFN78_18705 [Amycolatopsis antarctica]|uniref:Methyltransferase type 11 domain-containing protein n=1 Tax=Amycolatopsis antarctica TaxID=1854586 RepID=A0A263D248_9PSEU|nr:hypothetical protein [Amycolatopsis antarctica]OZM71566.1 hypothetical protein CFN78_18705 [Amycolatopsis antarctica]